MSENVVIEINDLSFAYEERPVLENVGFHVHGGDFAAIVGTNGGGKTTLLKLMLGLLKPQTGSIRIFGNSPEKARRRIGYMPQQAKFDAQFPITVQEVVLTSRLGGHPWLGYYTREDRRQAQLALEEVGLGEMGGRTFADLSGGQRQRVLIARALASQPELLMLDEPTANLDPQAEQDFYKLLHRLNERLTVVMVSHDLNFVSSFVNTVVCVNRRVVVHPTAEVPTGMAGDLKGRDMRVILHDQLTDCGADH